MAQNYTKPTTNELNSPSEDVNKIANNDDALLTNFSGSDYPINPTGCQHYYNTSNNILYVNSKNNDGTWITVLNCNKGLQGEGEGISTGIINIDNNDNGTKKILNGGANINLPNVSVRNRDFAMSFFIADNSQYVFNGDFYIDGTASVSQYTIENSLGKTIFIEEGLNGKLFVMFDRGGLAKDFSNIANDGIEYILNLVYFVGISISCYSDISTTLENIGGSEFLVANDVLPGIEFGFKWVEVASNGEVITAVKNGLQGNIYGNEFLNVDLAAGYGFPPTRTIGFGTSLTESQIPAHNHITGLGVEFPLFGVVPGVSTTWRNTSATDPGSGKYQAYTSTTGSGEPHVHKHNFKTVGLRIFRRIL